MKDAAAAHESASAGTEMEEQPRACARWCSKRGKRWGQSKSPALPDYIALTLSTLMVSPSILPVIVTFLPATSFTLSCSAML